MDCIFCKIADGEIPSNKVYEDDMCLAFYDVEPVAPVHVLIIPKHHFSSILETDATSLERLMMVARDIAIKLGLKENGFRLVINTGSDGGQTVQHLHIHILGGRNLAWPPG